jgi:hypothetical protein
MAAMLAFWIAAAQLVAARAAATNRSVSWWFDVAENQKTDAANAKAIADHRAAFSRVMPYNAKVTLDGNVSNWWGHDDDVAAWNAPLQKLGVPVLPYLIDTSNATEMHLVYANSTAVVADAVAIAEHYGFQGWFIDYEDEYPADSDPRKSEKLAAFLTELGDALHAKGMELTICVASWSGLLADYGTLANSSVDELQLMSTYANPSDSQSIIADYFAKIEATTGSTDKAGVGVGIYYDGRGGYDKDWTEKTARVRRGRRRAGRPRDRRVPAPHGRREQLALRRLVVVRPRGLRRGQDLSACENLVRPRRAVRRGSQVVALWEHDPDEVNHSTGVIG